MHCRLSKTESGLVLIDLNSKNGTWVNGARLTPFDGAAVTRSELITLASSIPFPWERIDLAPGRAPVFSASVPRKSITIGRAEGNDFRVDLPIVSSHHARVEMRDGRYFIEDTNSLNGTSINRIDRRITQPTLLGADDEVFLGSYKLSASALLSKFSTVRPTVIGEANFQKVKLKGDSMVIGRDPQCDHPLDYPMISWHHARITRTPGGVFVEDLNSRNGTFVEGKRITQVTRVELEQQIGLGSFRFELLPSGELAKRHDLGYTVEARDVAVLKGDKTILSPVSFTVYAGELVALMGTSGAGKTTLLKALNGYTPPSQGAVFYNGRSLYLYPDEYSQQIGYVPQDDIVHERLTVREALSYAARLRTPLTHEEIKVEVEKVAYDLDLSDKLNDIIGSPENKVLSGGQRKRVNIALELICGPPVLYLDEPTSGLSSADADKVVRLLKRLAREGGKTIVATIHAPSLGAYREFDNLIMLSRDPEKPGAMVFYGPAYPDAIQFVASKGETSSKPVNPNIGPEILMDTLLQDKAKPDPNNTTASWIARYKPSKYYKQFVQDRAGKNPSRDLLKPTDRSGTSVGFTQWLTLTNRNFKIRFRDKSQTWISFLQAPIFALLISGVFSGLSKASGKASLIDKDTFATQIPLVGGIHFLMVVAAVWFGCNNAIRDVVGEWLIYQRERMVCLRLTSYVFSKLFVLNGICLFQCLLMLSIVYISCNLYGRFWVFTLVLWLVSLVGAAIGLLISSAPFCKTTESAIALLPIVLLPMIGLGGGIQPLHNMASPAVWASNLVPTRWAYEANLTEEAKQRNVRGFMSVPCDAKRQQTDLGDLAEKSFPVLPMDADKNPDESDRSGLPRCLTALSAMFLTFVTGVMLSLKYRDDH
jgi:ABC-type multidrug transport system ATPase subunit/pSer/pThr/pTyr-binding forkhead associated (FHA) protein/ABC-type multidrug transport system permease subunit